MSSQPIEIKGSKKSIFVGIDLNYEGIETHKNPPFVSATL